jgi:hypothetical protein
MPGKSGASFASFFWKYGFLRSIFHFSTLKFGLGFPNPQRLGHFAPLSFTAYGGKIQVTRFAGGR